MKNPKMLLETERRLICSVNLSSAPTLTFASPPSLKERFWHELGITSQVFIVIAGIFSQYFRARV
jgi:hypothetical protein